MKKNYKKLLLALAVFTSFSSIAQISAYSFVQSHVTYSAITGGTVFGNSSSDDEYFLNTTNLNGTTSNYTGVGIPIGFNFVYNNNTYDVFGITANGWISLGQSSLTPHPINMTNGDDYNCISSSASGPAILQNKIGGLSMDLGAQGGSSIRAQTIGVSPNQTLVVQWTNYSTYDDLGSGTGGNSDTLNFQICLEQTTNKISIIYGNFLVLPPFPFNSVLSAEIGLRGTPNSDFNNRSVINGINIWNASTAGTNNSATATFASTLAPQNGQLYEWTPPLPCAGAPGVNTIIATPTLICSGGSSYLSLANNYTIGGLTYQWSKSASVSGPFTSISNATLSSLAVSNVISTTYYQLVVTCPNGPASTTLAPVAVNIAGTTINNIPYFEGFEGITQLNQLPNCSWAETNTVTCKTYTSTLNPYLTPESGTNFASFRIPTANAGSYFYTNGLNLTAGVIYSVSVGYITSSPNPFNNQIISEFSLLYGPNQSTVGLTNIASVTGTIISTTYNTLTNIFTVPTTGVYYIAIKGKGTGLTGGLTWDDLSITVPPPCSGAPAANTAIASATSVCTGNSSTLTLATTYTTVGLAYQWYSATNISGPYSAIPSATNASYIASNITAPSAFYEAVITCSAGPASTTSTPVQIISSSFTTTVPYFEGFEGLTANYQLPNCAWLSSNPASIANPLAACQTFTVAQGYNNLMPETGSMFANFRGTPSTTNYFWSNGIHLTAGTVYSASAGYITSGTGVWSDFSLSYGTSQSSTGLTTIAATGTTSNTSYISLANIFTVPTTGIYYIAIKATSQNYGTLSWDDLSVTAPLPCSGTPATNSAVTSSSYVCTGNSANLSLATIYTTYGLNYQWYSASTVTGPYTAIPTATNASYVATNITAPVTFYEAVITCTSGPASTTATPVQVQSGTYTTTVPYFESFEGITDVDQLPNCGWSISDPYECETFPTASGSYNQMAQTGNGYASFDYGTNPNGDYFWSDGIYLVAGTQYSASVGYITDGYSGWSNFSLLYGTSQSASGLTLIAGVTSGLTNTTYQTLANTFIVPTSGIYYIAIKCIGNDVPYYLTWDDLSVTAPPPCSGTPATNSAVASSTITCFGGSVDLSLANSYTVGGLLFQWYSSPNASGPYTAVTTATQNVFTATNVIANGWYNAVITCSAGLASTTSTPVYVNVLPAPTYTAIPFVENFDNQWGNRCDVHNVPVAANWSSDPTTGNDSWRRQDDGASANWDSSDGAVTPLTGAGCADFDSYDSDDGTTGTLSLYANLNSSVTYTMSFWYLNETGDDSLEVFLSTDGGATFTKKGGYLSGDYVSANSSWNRQVILLPGVSSPSCVINFVATSDYGFDDIGMDSLKIDGPCSISVTASPAGVCSGGSSTLTAFGATSYTWSVNTATTTSIIVTPTVLTTYSVIGMLGSCTTTAVQSVSIIPSPTLYVSSSASLICPGQSVLVSVNGAVTYTWNTGATGTVISVSPSVTTVYSVTGIDANNCIDTASFSQIVGCAGIKTEASAINGLSVYPNPNTGEFTVELSNNSSKHIEIMDVTGRIVLSNTSALDKINFNINNLAKGVYYIRIQSNNTVDVVKIIKQ